MPIATLNDPFRSRDEVRARGTLTVGGVQLPFKVAFEPPRGLFGPGGLTGPELKRALAPHLPLDRLELKTDAAALDALMAMDRRTPVHLRIDRLELRIGLPAGAR